MAENVSITGLVKKVTDARGGWELSLDANEDLEQDTGVQTFDIAALGSQALTVAADSDFITVKAPQQVNVTLTLTAGTFSVVPVRGIFVLQTAAIQAATIVNPSAEKSVKVAVALTKRAT